MTNATLGLQATTTLLISHPLSTSYLQLLKSKPTPLFLDLCGHRWPLPEHWVEVVILLCQYNLSAFVIIHEQIGCSCKQVERWVGVNSDVAPEARHHWVMCRSVLGRADSALKTVDIFIHASIIIFFFSSCDCRIEKSATDPLVFLLLFQLQL